jgi:hypothetical protein
MQYGQLMAIETFTGTVTDAAGAGKPAGLSRSHFPSMFSRAVKSTGGC